MGICHFDTGTIKGHLDVFVDIEDGIPVILAVDPIAQAIVDGTVAIAHQNGIGLGRLLQHPAVGLGGGHQCINDQLRRRVIGSGNVDALYIP